MDLKATVISTDGFGFRCADEETFKKVERAIEKMDSEDFIIKAEQEGENISISLNGERKQLLVALGCTVESMVQSARISPILISGIVNSAILRCTWTEGSEKK